MCQAFAYSGVNPRTPCPLNEFCEVNLFVSLTLSEGFRIIDVFILCKIAGFSSYPECQQKGCVFIYLYRSPLTRLQKPL